MTRPEPTILDRLQVGGLHPDLVAEFRDRHRRRKPCHCAACGRRQDPAPEPSRLGQLPLPTEEPT